MTNFSTTPNINNAVGLNTVVNGVSTTQTITLTNDEAFDIVLLSLSADSQWFAHSNPSNVIIATGDSTTFNITARALDNYYDGEQSATFDLALSSNISATPDDRFYFTASAYYDGYVDYIIDPSVAEFEDIDINGGSPVVYPAVPTLTFNITNLDPHAIQVSWQSNSTWFPVATGYTLIGASASNSFVVSSYWTDPSYEGNKDGTITYIISSSPGYESYHFGVSGTFNGTGADLTITPSASSFGSISYSATAQSMPVMVANGDAATTVILTAISVNSPYFTVNSSSLGLTVTAGATSPSTIIGYTNWANVVNSMGEVSGTITMDFSGNDGYLNTKTFVIAANYGGTSYYGYISPAQHSRLYTEGII